jgi:ubiquinone/menaquinone biosynthesis C-methylase UbiE
LPKVDYEYYGMKASTWDWWRGDTSNWSDRHFYLEIVREFGQPVLDVGCGTGRILLDFLQLGIDIDGVDNSPEMLAICREKAAKLGHSPALHQQEMESLSLPRTYRTIVVPSSSFQLITDESAAQRAMQRFFAHMQVGGALVAPFGFDWREGDPMDTGWELTTKTRPQDGAILRRWTREWHEPQAQLWHAEERFEIELNGKVIAQEHQRRSPGGRWYTQAQATELFRSAGFSEIELLQDFSRESARADARLFCVLARRR